MYTPTNQTVAAGSSVVSFNAVTYNFGGGTTNLTGSTVNGQGPYSYNPNVPGVYAVSISIMGQANNNPQLQQAFLYKNGAAFSAGPPITLRSPSTGDQNSSTLSDHVYLNGTSDYIQAVFYNNGANTLALVGAANNTWMSAVLVARD